MFLLPLIHTRGHPGTEKLDMIKVTQFVSGGASIQSQAVWIPVYSL